MKVAFAIDFLLTRTQEVFLLELLLAGHDEAEIYTLAHAPGKILGRVEMHRIHSSPLSHMVHTPEEARKKAWMLPGAARQVQIAPDVDKLFIISSGWAHTFVSGPKTERFCWVFDFAPKSLELAGWRKLFGFHHKEFKFKALEQEKHRAFASTQLEKLLGHEGAPIIRPGFKTDDYPMVPDDQHTGEYPFHLVLLNGAEPKRVREIFAAAKAANVPVKCLGLDEAYTAEKAKQDPDLEFIGDHCAATTAGYTHAARAVWILNDSQFPAEALGALCCGRPVVVLDTAANHEVLPNEGAWYLQKSVSDTFAQVNRDFLSPDKKVLRRAGLKFNERLFKNQARSWAGIKPLKSEE